jgi:hypothetical protein
MAKANRARKGKQDASATAEVKEAAPEVGAVDAAQTELDGKTPKRSKAEQLRLYKSRYESYQAANGSISMDNGDEVALALRGASPEAVMAAAEKLKGLEPGTLVARYAERNNGAKRMNAGNIIRGTLRAGTKTPKDVVSAIKTASKELNAVTK